MEDNNNTNDKNHPVAVPGEANTEKNIEFINIEEKDEPTKIVTRQVPDEEDKQTEWQKGIEDEEKALKPTE
ncbi:MAG TPA: hypothetical protein VM843_09690 [Flavisolibacter sp.]|jgi:hypothetical protein|nr:hypothetical protein [Flavisolibacter sp.]